MCGARRGEREGVVVYAHFSLFSRDCVRSKTTCEARAKIRFKFVARRTRAPPSRRTARAPLYSSGASTLGSTVTSAFSLTRLSSAEKSYSSGSLGGSAGA